MESRYADDDASRLVAALAPLPEAVALRTYTARLLGAESALVLHGGGNTSVKGRARTLVGEDVEVLYIKGSGSDLATIEPSGHPAVRLAPLRELRALGKMSDEAMVNELRLNLMDAGAPTPSVEALLHAYLPATFIDHTHADAILALADQPDGERLCRELFGRGLVWVPYVMPGFALAKSCAEAFERHRAAGSEADVIVLEKHGIFTFGETAKESYERMIEAVSRAERFIADLGTTASVVATLDPDPARQAWVLPRLRGALAKAAGEPPERGPVVVARASEWTLAFLSREDALELSQIGCATPDHVLRTKPTPLFLSRPDYSDPDGLVLRLEREIGEYAARYDAYFHEMCAKKDVTRTKLDPWPRVVLLPGVGICAVGKTRADAEKVADIYEHTLEVIRDATAVGVYAPVGRDHLFDVEYWSLEQAKIKRPQELALGGRIAVVTGAASGIGRATAARLLDLGAHVVLVDRDAEGLRAAEGALGAGRPAQVERFLADVTKKAAVRAAFAHAARVFGGVDLVVSNAGSAPEGRLETEAGDDALRQSLEVNLLSHNLVAGAAVDVMRAQGRGGCILFNASKSAFAPGPGFGPYAVAKSALVALMRQYAIDLGAMGIRANAVNADRIRTGLFEGGLLASRARSRGLSIDEYFRANLLAREVSAGDVADAFAYLATARSTTGCVVTVDGGNAAAFSR